MKNERVVIVGPSPHLEGMGLGNTIDGFDIVVRMNQGYRLMKELPNDYGSRVDMLFLNGWSSRNTSDSYLKKIYDIPKSNIFKKHTTNVKANFDKKYKVPYITNNNIGLITISSLLDMGYVNISLTGYSFYQTSKRYADGYISENKNEPDCNIEILGWELHDQVKNVSNLKYFVDNHNITMLDDTTYYYNKFMKEKYNIQ